MQTKRLVPINLGIPGNFKISQPFGVTLTFFKTYLSIAIPQKFKMLTPNVLPEYNIKYQDVAYFKHGLIFIRIFHHQLNMSKYVYIMGIAGTSSIYKEIKDCVLRNNLPLTMK